MTVSNPHWGLPDPDLKAEFYADVPSKRLLAWIVDSMLILALTILAIPFTAFTALFYLPLLWLAIGIGYRIVSLTQMSATPGMRLLAIEFRTGTGERFGLGIATLHTLIYSISIGSLLIQAVSVILMLTTARGQSLGDHLLGTAAINRVAAS